MFVLIGFAFLAGVVTILSPCILPVLPIVLSGGATGGKQRPLGIILGFILSFTFFTVFSFALLKAFGLSQESLRIIAIAALFLFGIALFSSKVQVWLEHAVSKMSTSAQGKNAQRSGFGGGILIGLSLGLLWTPCVGPILAGVITLAATSSVTIEAVLIALSYAVGTALPMLLIMYGGRALIKKVPGLLNNSARIRQVFGVLMILVSVGIAFDIDKRLQAYVLEAFPQYGTGLTKFEENSAVQQELNRLAGGGIEDMPMGQPMDTVKAQMGNTSSDTSSMNDSKNYPAAPNPNFEGATKWLNGEALTLDKLKGKVVLVDFWTYTCINCIRTLPYTTAWYNKYKDKGFVIIGVHTPEFEFEKNENNVRKAMEQYKIEYPVVQDNDYLIWKSYKNRFWPAEYFIDKNGKIRRTHFGEGEYEESEKFIQMLLEENGSQVEDSVVDLEDKTPTTQQSPETYLGYERLDSSRFQSKEDYATDKETDFTLKTETLSKNDFAYLGKWLVGDQRAMPKQGAKLEFNFESQEVYLVMRSSKQGNQVKVLLDGKPIAADIAGEDVKDGMVTVVEDRLYKLVKLPKNENHTLSLEFTEDGVEVYAFTFG